MVAPIGQQESYDTSKFDHEFSGISVWLEPDHTEELSKRMDFLRRRCGGDESGVSQFLPHVTLLYNLQNKGQQDDPKALLTKCWENFRSNKGNQTTSFSMIASDWYYFRYPKSADDGKGFGCSISFLGIQRSRWLEDLHQACLNFLGQGERDVFIPHLSMVYAPEEKEDFLIRSTKMESERGTLLNEPMPIKYLSLWSTQGHISEWYPILRIPINKAG